MGKASGIPKGKSKKEIQPKGELVFCMYLWIDGLKYFSSGGAYKGCNDNQGVIHNTYHGGNIETDHHVICLIP